jgi:LysR family transcriptional regulator, glycine cleavage system transcriptional activator
MHRSLPDPDALTRFLEVAAHEPDASAARDPLLLSLAAHLRTRLFEQERGRTVLTPAGMALRPAARAALEALSACGPTARGETAPAELVLGTRHELGLSWLVPQLARLTERFPGVTFHLYFGSGSDLENRLRTSEIDCAISSRPVQDALLAGTEIHREEYVFVAAPNLVRSRPLSSAADLPNHILLDAAKQLPLFSYLREVLPELDPKRFRGIRHLGTIDAVRLLAKAGAGVAVLPTYLVQQDINARELVVLLPHVRPRHDHFRLVYRASDPRRAFLVRLAEALAVTPLH